MPDQTDPLLGQQEGSEETDISNNLERGVGNVPGHDFRHLVDTQPEAVIKYASCSKLFQRDTSRPKFDACRSDTSRRKA